MDEGLFEQYRPIVDQTAKLAASLEKVLSQHLQCRLGGTF